MARTKEVIITTFIVNSFLLYLKLKNQITDALTREPCLTLRAVDMKYGLYTHWRRRLANSKWLENKNSILISLRIHKISRTLYYAVISLCCGSVLDKCWSCMSETKHTFSGK